MEQNLEDSVALLARTPSVVDALLRGLPASSTRANEGADTWSAFDVVVHLIHNERANWMPRVRTLLEFGESRAFAPFDRRGEMAESQGRELADLLDEFARLRKHSLDELQSLHLTAEQLARTGLHPALGVVTLSQLLAAWTAHDLTHLHQLSRILAGQYRERVGSWEKFLGVLHCNGHSAPS
jgi:hypothetical protein